MAKLKIIVVGTRGFPHVQGGVEAHCEHLYPLLVSSGCDVTVFTRQSYVSPSLKSYRNVNLVALSCPKNKFLEAIVHTFKGVIAARRMGCDILHVHAIGPSLMIPLARMLGLRVVMTHHGEDYARKKWNAFAKIILKMGEWLGCRWANQVISISKPIADHIYKKYTRKVVIIPNGVMLSEVSVKYDALKQYHLKKGKYILTVGRFVPEKGFHDLVMAVSRINVDLFPFGPRFKLVIVGDSDHEDQYSMRLKALAREDKNVILTGFLKDPSLKELYSHAGVFVLPSYHEGLPLVLLEAMSYGVSCVVSDIPANRNVDLADERHFKPGDIDALSKKLKEFMEKTFSKQEQIQQINYIKENYDWENITKKTLKVYVPNVLI